MKNKTLAILSILITIGLLSQSVSAASINHVGKVSRIYVGSDASGAVNFQLSDLSGCTPVRSNHYYVLDGAHSRFDETYALMLAAAHANQPVTIRIDDEACSTNVNSSIIYVLQNF